jgi:hypothetical protein
MGKLKLMPYEYVALQYKPDQEKPYKIYITRYQDRRSHPVYYSERHWRKWQMVKNSFLQQIAGDWQYEDKTLIVKDKPGLNEYEPFHNLLEELWVHQIEGRQYYGRCESRHQWCVDDRMKMCALMRRYTGASTTDLGEIFNLDHSTISSHLQKMESYILLYPQVGRWWEDTINNLDEKLHISKAQKTYSITYV